MEEDIKVSIIIPVHNTEKYLNKCLDSLIKQTLQNIEIICVDDGSTDCSLEILKEYASKDNRIKLISQHNKKQGAARNEGLKTAKGNYIGFVDSDDYVADDYFEKLYKTALSQNSDIACGSIVRVKNHTQKYRLLYENSKCAATLNDKLKICTSVRNDYNWNVWNKLYKKSFLIENNIWFDEGVYFEDVNFTINIMKKSPAEILFRDTEIQKEIEKQKQQRKNELLDILGDKATKADVLYGSEESLKKKIKEYGLQPFSQDKEQHEILRQLSIYCYDDGKQAIPKGYERVGHFESKNNGFDSVVVKNDKKKEIVIAFRGMEPPKDLPTTIRAGALNYTSQQQAAQAVYEKIKQDPRFKDYKIQTTGQSLGGYLAQYVAAKNDLKSATFNAYHGTKEALSNEAARNFQTKIIHPNNIVNYRNKEDAFSKSSAKNNLGLSLETDAKIKRRSWNKIEEPHMAENMGKLDNARVKKQDYDNHTTTKFGLISPIFLGKTQNFIHDTLNQQ